MKTLITPEVQAVIDAFEPHLEPECRSPGAATTEVYRVVWTMDIEAESFEEAAQKALAIHRDPESIATIFNVQSLTGETRCIDVEGDDL